MEVIFSFSMNEHIILSMKGGDVRNTYLLTEHKICNFQGEKIHLSSWMRPYFVSVFKVTKDIFGLSMHAFSSLFHMFLLKTVCLP